MVCYEFKCLSCERSTEIFLEMHEEKPKQIKCEYCGEQARRIFTTSAGYVKKVRVGDVWDKAGVNPTDHIRTKQRNAARVRKMQEQAKINKERQRREGNL